MFKETQDTMPKEIMKKLITEFPAQIKNALESVKKIELDLPSKIYNIHVAGVGGSGISASYTKELIRYNCSVPYEVSKRYHIPSYVDEHTLFIVSSYSGDTEEILNAIQEAIERKAQIVCVTTGGDLERIAKENNFNLVNLPKGEDVPRAYFGTSLVHQIGILQKAGLVSGYLESVGAAIELLETESNNIQKEAKEIAKAIAGKLPIIYATERIEPAALRWRQQINENAKQLAWHSYFPELNHNELQGWTKTYKDTIVINLRNDDDYKRNAVRVDVSKTIIADYCDQVLDVFSKGASLVEKMIYLTHLGDWVSYYLAEELEVDPIPVDVIARLKKELAKVN